MKKSCRKIVGYVDAENICTDPESIVEQSEDGFSNVDIIIDTV